MAGSGNLTESGLLGNWEAYSVETLNDQEMTDVQTAWDSWTSKHDESLLPLDDPRVRERVALNHLLARAGDLPTLVASEAEPEPIQLMPLSAAVLLAELPGGDRWKQAGFDQE